MLKRIILIIIIFFCALNGFAQNKDDLVFKKLSDLQNDLALTHASIGIAVGDCRTGELLFESEPQLSLVPASVLKLVTTATALEVFSPEFRFQTELAYTGILRNDTLFGNLAIIGGGDPTLGSKYFPENQNFLAGWINALQDKDIHVIKGNLVLDASIYEEQSIPDTWIWEDMGNYFGAGASGLSVFDNLYEIHLSSENIADKLTKVIGIVPEIPDLNLKNEVRSSDLNSDQAYVFGSPMDANRVIRGTIPKGRTDFVVEASVPNSAALLANEFRKKLQAAGIIFSGETKFEKVAEPFTNLAVTQSPPLADIISVTNHESVNLFAEHLLKHLAFQRYGTGATKEGCKFTEQFWKEKGIDLHGFFMSDGSGLSRFNALTATQLISILNYMKTKSHYTSDFYQSLPTPGSGTLATFSEEKFPGDCLRAKSGSMTRVRCYAGYLTTISGRQFSFAVMLNNFTCSQTEAIKKIEEMLAGLRKI
jgi:D-alanyl-D-alanine carboxypeptidase/D-alanyl-D-alanine-endopeptidase (penicillin-binding protein 4)